MTICVAAICNGGKTVVVAADRMVSAHFLTVEFDHPNAKIDNIGSRCVALSSGDVLSITDILSESSGISGQLQNPSVILITNEIKERFVQVRARLLHERFFQPRGLSFKNCYADGSIQRLPPDMAILLDNQVQNFELGTSLLIAGVDNLGGHIYCINDPGTSQCFDRLGYYAIGSGYRHAILSLVTVQHSTMVNLVTAVYNVYQAKRQAEIAPGVGTGTDMRIIRGDKIEEIQQNQLDVLSKIYENQKRASLDMSCLEKTFASSKEE